MTMVHRSGMALLFVGALAVSRFAAASEPRLVPSPEEAPARPVGDVGPDAGPPEVVADSGFEGGVRGEAGKAFGDSGHGRSLSDELDVRGGVWLDLGYRLNPTWTLSGFLQGGWGGATCLGKFGAFLGSSGACSFTDYRVGVEAQYRFDRPNSGAWLGFGVGYLQLLQRWQGQYTPDSTLSVAAGGTVSGPVSATFKETKDGPFVLLQGGWDWKIDGFLSGGPYAAYHLGAYSGGSAECASSLSCSTVDDLGGPGPFHWFSIGIRAVVAP